MTVELANHIKERKIIERRNYIYKLLHYDFFVKDTYIEMPGTIILHYNGKEYKFKTKDLGRRLDEIIRDLQKGKSYDRRVNEIAQGGEFKSLQNLDKLNIEIEKRLR